MGIIKLANKIELDFSKAWPNYYASRMWCQERFGEPYWAGNNEGIWDCLMHQGDFSQVVFCFDRGEDLTLFALRWL